MGDEEMKEWKKSTFCLISASRLFGEMYCRLKHVFHGLFAIFLSHKMFYDKLKMWHPEAKLICPKVLDEILLVCKTCGRSYFVFWHSLIGGKCNFKSDWWDYNAVIECSNLQEICMNIDAKSRMVRFSLHLRHK